jgi:hypothetical protein
LPIEIGTDFGMVILPSTPRKNSRRWKPHCNRHVWKMSDSGPKTKLSTSGSSKPTAAKIALTLKKLRAALLAREDRPSGTLRGIVVPPTARTAP